MYGDNNVRRAPAGDATIMRQPRSIVNPVSGIGGLSPGVSRGSGEPVIPGGQFLGTKAERERLRAGGPGYQAFSKEALAAPGSSPWEMMMREKQGTEEASARDTTQAQSAAMGGNIWNQMAMRGGAGSGARERAAMAGQRAGMEGMQGVARQGTEARQNIATQAEQQRQGLLAQLPGMEMNREMYGGDLAQRDYENMLKKYALQQTDWAARQTADAIAGKK